MVEVQRMATVADVVAAVREGRLDDFVREAVALVARELMESEISAEIGAELSEVAPKRRVTHRNGTRPRAWETRVGEIELLIPRKRSGPSYFPSFLEARRPAEQAIVAVVMEAYVNGVSTRKVDRLVEQLGRLRATYNRQHGIRYIFAALDVHRDRLYARMRPRRAGPDVLGFMRTIRMVYPARQKLYWIQDNLSANWTPDIRAYAATNKIELVPTPTYTSYLNRIESHFRPIQEFVFNNTDYRTWDTAQRALADYITHRNGRDQDRRIAALERKHRIAA
jgi:hypothetical protein